MIRRPLSFLKIVAAATSLAKKTLQTIFFAPTILKGIRLNKLVNIQYHCRFINLKSIIIPA